MITYQVNAFSNTLDAFPPTKKIQELCTGISTKDYLLTTFQWSQIVNKQFCGSKLLVQQ